MKKPKKQSRDTLKKKAWKVFSAWVRKRDKRCVTCGSYNQLCAGHFWHGVLDFDEINVNCQCKQCNTFKSGNLAPYSVYLIRKYGQNAFEDLEKRHYIAMRGEYRTDGQYQEIINKYST
jgi:hypothetical protein